MPRVDDDGGQQGSIEKRAFVQLRNRNIRGNYLDENGELDGRDFKKRKLYTLVWSISFRRSVDPPVCNNTL